MVDEVRWELAELTMGVIATISLRLEGRGLPIHGVALGTIGSFFHRAGGLYGYRRVQP